MTDFKKFQRRVPPLVEEPPDRVTTRDIGKKIGEDEEDFIDNLEKLADQLPEDCTIEEAKEIAGRILEGGD